MYRTATWTFKNTKDFKIEVLSVNIDNGCFNLTLVIKTKQRVLDDCDGYLVYVDMTKEQIYMYRFPSEYIATKIYKKYKRNKGNFLKSIKPYSVNERKRNNTDN